MLGLARPGLARPGRARRVARLVACLAIPWGAPAVALAAPPAADHVRELLSSVEHVPGRETWRALGPATLGVLVALYDDPREPTYVRLRAVSAAAHYPSPAARTFLLAVARAEGQVDLFVRAALVALGRAFGAAAVADVAPFLAHEDPDVREGAILALVTAGDDAARAALRAHRPRETRPHLRARLDAALADAPPVDAPPVDARPGAGRPGGAGGDTRPR